MPKIFARAYGARIKGLLSYPNRPKIVAKFVVFTCGLPKKHTVFPQFSSFYTSGKISWQSVKTFCLGTPLEKFLATPLGAGHDLVCNYSCVIRSCKCQWLIVCFARASPHYCRTVMHEDTRTSLSCGERVRTSRRLRLFAQS